MSKKRCAHGFPSIISPLIPSIVMIGFLLSPDMTYALASFPIRVSPAHFPHIVVPRAEWTQASDDVSASATTDSATNVEVALTLGPGAQSWLPSVGMDCHCLHPPCRQDDYGPTGLHGTNAIMGLSSCAPAAQRVVMFFGDAENRTAPPVLTFTGTATEFCSDRSPAALSGLLENLHGVLSLLVMRARWWQQPCCKSLADSSDNSVAAQVGDGSLRFVRSTVAERARFKWPVLLPSAPGVMRPTFKARAVRVCGQDISHTSTADGTLAASGVLVALDWSQFELSLPEELFNAVVVWVNITCSEFTRSCLVPPGVTLPSLFITDAGSGERFELPLSSFISRIDTSGGAVLAMKKVKPSVWDFIQGANVDAPDKDEDGANQSNPPAIVIGSIGLRSLKLMFANDRVGFRILTTGATSPAPTSNATPTIGCVAAVRCHGNNRFIAQQNRCVDPVCPRLFLKTYDRVNNECSNNSVVITFLVILLLLVICGEVVIHIQNENVRKTTVESKKQL